MHCKLALNVWDITFDLSQPYLHVFPVKSHRCYCCLQADGYVEKHGGSVLVLALGAINYPGVLGGKIIKPADKFSVLNYNLGSGSPEADELQQYFPGGCLWFTQYLVSKLLITSCTACMHGMCRSLLCRGRMLPCWSGNSGNDARSLVEHGHSLYCGFMYMLCSYIVH